MKKIYCLIIVGILAAIASFTISGAEDPTQIPVVIITNPGNPGRSVSPAIFSAQYYEAQNSVLLMCSTSCGNVSVTLESTAGDWFQTVFDSRDGSTLIPVSGTSGHYTLTMQTLDGVVYQGEFDII